MRPEEIAALGELAGDGARATAAQIHGVHAGVAERVWRAVGPAALPVRITHDLIARGAYAAAGELSRAAVRAGTTAVALAAAGRQTASLEDSAVGRAVVGVLNGAVGDTLHERGNRLALPMTLRQGGRGVEPTGEGLGSAFPHATGALAVFIHGLGQTDDAWTWRASHHPPYGDRLQAELGYTPVYLRYNTGRHVSENGRELAALLARVTAAWPVEVQEIALVGHSVGGLVARSACHYGAESAWTRKVRHVFTLGSPHGGAPLARLAGTAGAALAKLPETRPVAAAVNARSAGIKDLGHGYLVDEDWREPGAPALVHRDGRPLPFLAGAEHCFISASLAAGPRAHFDLLNHPVVYAQIRGRLSSRPALPARRLGLPAPQRP